MGLGQNYECRYSTWTTHLDELGSYIKKRVPAKVQLPVAHHLPSELSWLFQFSTSHMNSFKKSLY